MLIPTAEPYFFPGDTTGCLLIHGFTSSPKELRLLGEHLANEGRSVLGVRLFAHATQPEDMRRARWRDWVASAEDGWHLLQPLCQRVVLVGMSMGGAIAFILASRFPATGVAALATPHHTPGNPPILLARLLSLVMPYREKGPPQWVDMEAFKQHVRYPVESTRSYLEFDALLGEMRRQLPKVKAPVLLVNSRKDPTIRAEERHMESIHAALGSREVSTHWVENSGHILPWDCDRREVFQEVSKFIARLR